jgi:hypothetical protein
LVAGADWVAGASSATAVNARLAAGRLPFSLGEKVADEVGRMRDRAEHGSAPNPHPQPLSRWRGESRLSPRQERAALPFSPGEKVAP